jgi:hypothetical protein
MLQEDHMSFSGCQFLAAKLEFFTRMIMSGSLSSVIASQDLCAVGSCPEQQYVSNWVVSSASGKLLRNSEQKVPLKLTYN